MVDNLYLAPNTITQRMEGPKCSATISLDVSPAERWGCSRIQRIQRTFRAFVSGEGDAKRLVMSTNVVNFDNTPNKAIASVGYRRKRTSRF